MRYAGMGAQFLISIGLAIFIGLKADSLVKNFLSFARVAIAAAGNCWYNYKNR